MSTQSVPSILFTHRSPQHGFRLLELPPDLAELLASDNPPTLELKSLTQSSATAPTTTPTPEYVNLCTPTKTYSIRQVQSSNSLHILTPSTGGAVRKHDLSVVGEAEEQEDVDMDRNLNVEGTVTSIAKCGSTLELHTPSEGFSATEFLSAVVKVYGEGAEIDDAGKWEGDVDMQSDENGNTAWILDGLFADIPVSKAQCERGWEEMCGFVLPPRAGEALASAVSSYCWHPSAAKKLEVWKRIAEGSVLQGIDLGKQFLVRDLWKSVLDDDGNEPFPMPLFKAVVGRIRGSGDGVIGDLKWASIDKDGCVRWVGETYLEATAPGASSAISEGELLDAWRDQLPESWRDNVSLSILPETCYMHPEPKSICFATEADRQKVKKNLPTDTSAATAAKKTRNWHELFKNQKRQKR
ncbi:hypothetical protein BJY01DRAFT_47248 [Aspergillus pseudoustus]|uniref:Sister chromatid cohesion protein Dcc1 n=1 Tax=Aspergillus pseudoustus TaxID=1810923 RepID=A0ABR4JC88_9EURO